MLNIDLSRCVGIMHVQRAALRVVDMVECRISGVATHSCPSDPLYLPPQPSPV
jgi:hypothetical protein